MFTVYVLRSGKTGRYYVGFTSDIENRLRKHNSGSNISTKAGRPRAIVYQEIHQTKASAWKREQQIKSYKGGEAFKKLIS